jgi:hypothetical protein
MTEVVEDNLVPAVRFWREQVPRRPRVRDIFEAAANTDFYARADTRRVVQIHNNVITFPLLPPGLAQFECDEGCNPQLAEWVEAMRAAVRVYKLKLPDVVFRLNGGFMGESSKPP